MQLHCHPKIPKGLRASSRSPSEHGFQFSTKLEEKEDSAATTKRQAAH